MKSFKLNIKKKIAYFLGFPLLFIVTFAFLMHHLDNAPLKKPFLYALLVTAGIWIIVELFKAMLKRIFKERLKKCDRARNLVTYITSSFAILILVVPILLVNMAAEKKYENERKELIEDAKSIESKIELPTYKFISGSFKDFSKPGSSEITKFKEEIAKFQRDFAISKYEGGAFGNASEKDKVTPFYQFVDANGNPLYETDKNGNFILDKDGNPKLKMVHVGEIPGVVKTLEVERNKKERSLAIYEAIKEDYQAIKDRADAQTEIVKAYAKEAKPILKNINKYEQDAKKLAEQWAIEAYALEQLKNNAAPADKIAAQEEKVNKAKREAISKQDQLFNYRYNAENKAKVDKYQSAVEVLESIYAELSNKGYEFNIKLDINLLRAIFDNFPDGLKIPIKDKVFDISGLISGKEYPDFIPSFVINLLNDKLLKGDAPVDKILDLLDGLFPIYIAATGQFPSAKSDVYGPSFPISLIFPGHSLHSIKALQFKVNHFPKVFAISVLKYVYIGMTSLVVLSIFLVDKFKYLEEEKMNKYIKDLVGKDTNTNKENSNPTPVVLNEQPTPEDSQVTTNDFNNDDINQTTNINDQIIDKEGDSDEK